MTFTTEEFPVIDFSSFEANKQAVAAEIFEAASKWGFLVLKGHGIPSEDVRNMFTNAKTFFTQPKAVKEEKWMNTQQVGYDYKTSVVGIQEGFCFGSVQDANLTHPNLSSWWDMPKRLEAEDFRAKCQNLSYQLLNAFAIAMGLPEDYFVEAHDSAKEPGNVLRLIKYPATKEQPDASLPRLSEHTDWGTLTLLFTESPGLEVSPPNGQGWVMAPVIEDAVIVNIADGLAMWSGKTLKSTKHRLSWESLPHYLDRHSMAYFVNANADAPLTLLERDGTSFKVKETPFKATFGDYQVVRMRMIHEKFDTDGTDQELKIDPKFMRLVRDIGVAHGTKVTFEGVSATA